MEMEPRQQLDRHAKLRGVAWAAVGFAVGSIPGFVVGATVFVMFTWPIQARFGFTELQSWPGYILGVLVVGSIGAWVGYETGSTWPSKSQRFKPKQDSPEAESDGH